MSKPNKITGMDPFTFRSKITRTGISIQRFKILKLWAYRYRFIPSSLIKQNLCREHTISIPEVLSICNNGNVDPSNKKYKCNDVYPLGFPYKLNDDDNPTVIGIILNATDRTASYSINNSKFVQIIQI